MAAQDGVIDPMVPLDHRAFAPHPSQLQNEANEGPTCLRASISSYDEDEGGLRDSRRDREIGLEKEERPESGLARLLTRTRAALHRHPLTLRQCSSMPSVRERTAEYNSFDIGLYIAK